MSAVQKRSSHQRDRIADPYAESGRQARRETVGRSVRQRQKRKAWGARLVLNASWATASARTVGDRLGATPKT